jgi:hypothetical protein
MMIGLRTVCAFIALALTLAQLEDTPGPNQDCRKLMWAGEGGHPTKKCKGFAFHDMCAKSCAPWKQYMQAGGELNAQPRRALVIGNGEYSEFSVLANAKNDAQGMSTKLRSMGFVVSEVYDGDLGTMGSAIGSFIDSIMPGMLALFYYAGHGAAHDGKNYLLPTDTRKDTKPVDLVRRAFTAKEIVDRMEDKQTKLNIVLLDACRNNPFHDRKRGDGDGDGGMVRMDAPEGSIIVFAAKSGQTAGDGKDGSNHGVFTGSLLRHFDSDSHLPLMQIVDKVRDDVFKCTGGAQRPEVSQDLLGNARRTMLDGNLAMEGGSGGSGDDGGSEKFAKLKAKQAKLEAELSHLQTEKSAKRLSAEEREAQGKEGEKKQAEANAVHGGAEGRKKQAVAHKQKLIADQEKTKKRDLEKAGKKEVRMRHDLEKADKKELRMGQEQELARQQQEFRAKVDKQRKEVARLEKQEGMHVAARDYDAAKEVQIKLQAAGARLLALEQPARRAAESGAGSIPGYPVRGPHPLKLAVGKVFEFGVFLISAVRGVLGFSWDVICHLCKLSAFVVRGVLGFSWDFICQLCKLSAFVTGKLMKGTPLQLSIGSGVFVIIFRNRDYPSTAVLIGVLAMLAMLCDV